MKKSVFVALFVLTVVLCFSACDSGKPVPYEYMHPNEDIEKVEIATITVTVKNTEVYDTSEAFYCDIEDIDAFVADIDNLECYLTGYPPFGLLEDDVSEDKVFKIIYKNGDYELINHRGQAEYTIENDDFDFYETRFRFNEEEFENLIEKYSDAK